MFYDVCKLCNFQADMTMVSVPKSHAASTRWAYLVTTVYCEVGAKKDWMRLCALLLWEHSEQIFLHSFFTGPINAKYLRGRSSADQCNYTIASQIHS